MKKITRQFICVTLVLLTSSGLWAQMSGTYNVPSNFSTIAAAINSLNAVGVSGAVTINISAGHTETATAGGYSLFAVAGASSANPITFQKSGIGANPLITAYTGTANPSSAAQDGVWRLIGADYITIDGIDIFDPNTSNPANMEFGYGLFKASVIDGCQNNTIKNCVITLQRGNNAASAGPAVEGSRGIEMVNALSSSHTVAVTPTVVAGSNSNNKFYSNTIQNCNIGIALIGYAAGSSSLSLTDTGNDIGGNSASTGNTIINFGGGATASPAAGIRTLAQYNINVSYNTINNNNGSGVNHATTLRGIYINTALSANASINNNTLTMQGGGTTQVMEVIRNSSGSTAAGNVININNNVITNCTYTTATSADFYAIINAGSAATVNINGNTVSNLNYSSTGSGVLIETGSPTNASCNSNTVNNISDAGASGSLKMFKTSSPTNLTMNNNLIDGVSWTNATSSGGTDVFYSFSSAANVTINNNIIRNILVPSSGYVNGIREYGGSGTKIIQNNQLYNFFTTPGGAGGSFYGISCSIGTMTISGNTIYSFTGTGGTSNAIAGIWINSSGTSANINKNKLYDLSSTSTGVIIDGIKLTSSTTNTICNNIIGNLTASVTVGSNAIMGLNIDNGNTNYIYYNTVMLNAVSSGSVFGSSALYATTSSAIDLRNNILVNNSTPSSTGLSVAYRRSSTTLTTYSASSNNNLFYAGNPSANNLLFYDGTNSFQNLLAYKTFLSNRDGLSVTENPTFVSTTGSNANFLNINASVTTQIESGATPVTGITDDYIGTTRNMSTPDIGAWEGAFTPAPACSGIPAAGSLVSMQSAVCPSVSFSLYYINTYTNSGISYQWLSSTTGSTSGFSAIPNATLASFTNTNLTAATWYQLGVTCAASGSVYSTIPVQVMLGPPVLNAVSNTTFMCTGQSANLSLSGTVSGMLYQWMASTTGSTIGYSAITGATLATRTNTGTVGTNWYQTVLSCSANTSYSTTTNPVSVVVGVVPTATASSSVGSATVCASSNGSLLATTDVGTNFSWTGPNSYTSNIQNPLFINMSSGVYTLVTSINGCNSSPATVTLSTMGVLFASSPVATPSAICLGSSTQLQIAYPSVKVNKYNFTPSTGSSLVSITAGSTVVPSSVDDAPMGAPAAIGFNFNFNGVTYNQFTASPDGWVMLGGATGSNQFSNLVTSNTNTPKLYPYWDDVATGTTGYVRTQLFGSSPTRSLVIEWFVTIPRNTTGPANSTFQAILYEVNGTVEFRYGTMGSSSMSASSGLTGDASTFNCLTFSSSSASNSTVTANNTNTAQPSPGTSYMFTIPTVTYSWSPAAGLSSTTLSAVTGTPSGTTIYSVDLGFEGCNTTKTVAVNVTTPPTVNIVASNTAICPATSATLTANGANTYTWNTGATTTIVVVSPTANVNTYTVQGSVGPCTVEQTVAVNIPGSPTITISGSSGICTGQNASLTASGASTYTWDNGAITNSIVTTPTSNTTYTVTGTDALGCSTTTTQLVTVASSLSISISGPTVICLGQSANLSASGGVTYLWDDGSTTTTIAPTPTANTTYSVIGSSGTCSNTASTSIVINQNPTVTISGNTVICVGQITNLSANGASTYTWNTTATNASIAVSPSVNTSYNVIGTNSLGCESSTTIAVVSNSLPVLSIAQTNTAICAFTSVTFTVSGASTYTWMNGPNTATVTQTPTVNSTYTVSGTDGLGCTSTTTVAVTAYSLPIISISPSSATVCSLTQANFTASGASTYTWNNSIPGASASFTPASNSTYTVTGNSSQGCSSMTTVAVVTNSLPIIGISPASATVCPNTLLNLAASGASTYVWSNGPTSSSITLFPSNSSTYTVTGTNAFGCVSTASVGVTAYPASSITISPSLTTVCLYSPITFTASGVNTYTWSMGGNGSMATVPSVSNTANSYIVSGTDAFGCFVSSQAVVLTNTLPVISISPASPTVCSLSQLTLTASGAANYTWTGGANTSSVVFAPATNTVYNVSGSDLANGCIGTKTIAVFTNSLPVVGVSSSATMVCYGTTITFTAAGATTYTWNGGTIGSTGITFTDTPLSSTTYSVKGKNSQGCSSTGTISIVINQLPVIAVTPVSPTICAKETVQLTASGATVYAWSASTVTSNTFNASPFITSTYIITGTDANGCTNTGSVTVNVDKCSGVNEIGQLDNFISIFPNPSSGLITIKFEFEGEKEIYVTNSIGELIEKTSTTNGQQNIDLTGKAKGVYFIKLNTNTTSANYRIIIQ
jgi:hypothetical protein